MRRLNSLSVVLIVGLASCGGDPASGNTSDNLSEGSLSRMFSAISEFFTAESEKDAEIADAKPFDPPEFSGDPAVDELFDTMGVDEVPVDEDGISVDGTLVGSFPFTADPDDEDAVDEDLCFFVRPPGGKPLPETLWWLEMYGFRSEDGRVSDISGEAIDKEVVGGTNEGGGETRVIFYVNGIKNEPEDHCETLQAIANVTGAVVIGVMNETHGTVADVWESVGDILSLKLERAATRFGLEQVEFASGSQAATTLANIIVERRRAGKKVELWAHSQGGAITSLALHRAVRRLEQEGQWPPTEQAPEDAINVVTLASAAPAWRSGDKPVGPRYRHFVHRQDLTPMLFGIGAPLRRPVIGGYAQLTYFEGERHDEDDTSAWKTVPADDVSFTVKDLHPDQYHSIAELYLPVYMQVHGDWSNQGSSGSK